MIPKKLIICLMMCGLSEISSSAVKHYDGVYEYAYGYGSENQPCAQLVAACRDNQPKQEINVEHLHLQKLYHDAYLDDYYAACKAHFLNESSPEAFERYVQSQYSSADDAITDIRLWEHRGFWRYVCSTPGAKQKVLAAGRKFFEKYSNPLVRACKFLIFDYVAGQRNVVKEAVCKLETAIKKEEEECERRRVAK